MTTNLTFPLIKSLIITIIFSVSIFAQSKPQRPTPKPTPTPAQIQDFTAMRREVFDLASKGQHLKALPTVEKIASSFPEDAELWAIYGIAVLANSAVLETPEQRLKERRRGREILVKAKNLGTDNTMALHFLDQIPEDGGADDNFTSENPKFEEALRNGERFFGTGEYEKAFTEYEKAYKLNPKSYEAVLFMGDALYASGKYKESEVWFAKAVEIDPNREQAFRFWGDALMYQKKHLEARDKFVEAVIAEPFSRMTWDRLNRWIEETKTKITPFEIIPPGNEPSGDIVIDEKLLKAEDGTIHWKTYADAVRANLSAKKERYTLAAEVAAWKKFADGVRKELQTGKIKYPDKSLINLIKLDDAGLLESYILLLRPHEDFGEDFFKYREKNRDKMRRFITEFLLGTQS